MRVETPILALVLLVASTVAPGPTPTTAKTDTIHVCWDGGGDYLTIQEGIDATPYDDEFVVREGTHIAKSLHETRYAICNNRETRTYAPPRGGCNRSGLISDLPLSGDLLDRVTGQCASFSRASEAYTIDGIALPADTPRFEQLALSTGYEWDFQLPANQLIPLVIASGELFAIDSDYHLYASSDGFNFVERYAFPGVVSGRSGAFCTPSGALLVCLRYYEGTNDTVLVRSKDQGHAFKEVLEFPAGAWALEWSFTALNQTIFVSEYGQKYGGDNARRIYRSEDDGHTWQLVYNPEPEEGHHNHRILADPYRACVYQAFGDDRPGILCSHDGGDSWEELHDFFQPTAGVVRPDAVCWGHDGTGPRGVERFEPDTGRWTFPLQPFRGLTPSGTSRRTGEIYTMIEHEGVIYAPLYQDNLYCGQEMNDVWASVDGTHWAFTQAFDLNDRGIGRLVGELGGWIHAKYYGFFPEHGGMRYAHLRFRPGQVRTLTGLRIEPPAENLLSADISSFEDESLDGWEHSPAATIEWDTNHSYHGQASVRSTDPNRGSAFWIKCPALVTSLPVGSAVRGQIRLLGDESLLLAYLYDENNDVMGPTSVVSASDEWTLYRSEMTVTHADNSIRLVLRGCQVQEKVATIWLDGYQITEGETGKTWQLGDSPRAGESVVNPVVFPSEWTGSLRLRPDFNSNDVHLGWRTLQSWVQDASNYAKLIFDPGESCFKLVEVVAGEPEVLSESEPVTFWRGWACRFVLRSSTSGSEFRVKIGSTEVCGGGSALSVQPKEIWIGSSPAGDDQAPGLYTLSRTFGEALTDEELELELDFLPDSSGCDGDLDGDGDTDQGDLSILLADWGCNDPANGCAGDLDGDDDTDHCDLGILLADWGCGTGS